MSIEHLCWALTVVTSKLEVYHSAAFNLLQTSTKRLDWCVTAIIFLQSSHKSTTKLTMAKATQAIWESRHVSMHLYATIWIFNGIYLEMAPHPGTIWQTPRKKTNLEHWLLLKDTLGQVWPELTQEDLGGGLLHQHGSNLDFRHSKTKP